MYEGEKLVARGGYAAVCDLKRGNAAVLQGSPQSEARDGVQPGLNNRLQWEGSALNKGTNSVECRSH